MHDSSISDVVREWLEAWSGPEPCALTQDAKGTALDWELPRRYPELAWSAIRAVLEQIGDNVQDHRFAALAAGPLEDLMDEHGEAFIDRVEAEAKRNPAFALLLGGVWRSTIESAVWERMGSVARRGW